MSQVPLEPQNPYESPAVEAPLEDRFGSIAQRLIKVLKDFRAQIVALGAFWIFIGIVALGIGFGASFAQWLDRLVPDRVTLFIFGSIGTVWIGLGIVTCLKQIGAVNLGLALSYLFLVGSLLRCDLCTMILLFLGILQGHRVLGWVNELHRAGVPLTAKRLDL